MSIALLITKNTVKSVLDTVRNTNNIQTNITAKLDDLNYKINLLTDTLSQVSTTVDTLNTYVTSNISVQSEIQSNGLLVNSTNQLGQMILDKIIYDQSINNTSAYLKNKPAQIFGITGAATYTHNENIQEYIDKKNIAFTHVSNEAAGCHAAAYYGEATNTVGIAMTTAGPGTAMAVTGIACAYNEEKPLICFCGVPTSVFQVIDPIVMKGVTKAMFFIDPTVINSAELLDNAFIIARNGTTVNPGPGPVVVFVRLDAWNTTYIMQPNYTPYVITNPNISSFMNKIIDNNLPSKKIILRVGGRLSIDKLHQLAELTRTTPNFFLSLTFSGKNNINISSFSNCAVEGKFGNSVANINYADADIIIEIGVGIIYSLLTYDDNDILAKIGVNTNVYSIFDETPTREPLSYVNRLTAVMSVEYFVEEFLKRITNDTPTTQWNTDLNAKITNQQNTLSSYMNQTMTDTILNSQIFTQSAVIANIINTFYNVPSNTPTLLKDNNLYIVDVGAISFIADQLIYHTTPGNVVSFDQFSPIGSSPAVASGRIRSGIYDDIVLFCGDGGFLNTVSYVIDLQNSLISMNRRCLFILSNDHQYTNVALGEESIFGYTTSITSTNSIQKNINMFKLLKSLCGGSVKSISKTNISCSNNITEINIFAENWYNKSEDFTLPGIYVIYYETPNTYPSFVYSN